MDNVRFCFIAHGSLTEVQSHMALAHDLSYLPGKQLNNYIAYLKRSKQGEKEFPSGYTIREEPALYHLDNQDEDSTNHYP